MKELIKDLTVEWLGTITEEVARYISKELLNDNDSVNKFLVKHRLNNPKDDFVSIYKYSYVKYSLIRHNQGIGEVFSLKSVVDLFKEYFYTQDTDSINFKNKLINELSFNAFRKKSLTDLYYSRESINFIAESKLFIEIFYEAIHINRTPAEIIDSNTLTNISNELLKLNQLLNDSKIKYDQQTKIFEDEYKSGLKKKINKLSFHGIELPTVNRPREIDLFLIFEEPNFIKPEKTNVNFHSFRYDSSIIENLSTLWSGENGAFFNKNTFINNSIIGRSIYINSEIFIDGHKEEYFLDELHSIKGKNRIINAIRKNSKANFINEDNPELENKNTVEIKDLFTQNNRIALLGDPGAGKSSLIKYISLLCIKGEDDKLGINKSIEYTPIIIPLKDYNKYKIELKGSIVNFIFDYLKSYYQVTINNTSSLEEILINEKIIFFFDGLDEIFDINERISVKDDIELFSPRYINSIIIVTSRFESYKEVFFDYSIFNTYILNHFDDVKINNFIVKWFSADEDQEISNIKTFTESLKVISPDLKRNPLLLTLILLIYKYEKDLPKSKIDIYENCTKTLIERRDEREKNLEISNKIKNKLSLLSVLAYWQYSILSKKSNETISYSNVTKLLTTYLVTSKIIEDTSDAQKNVEIFLEFAKIRSIYFENNFTHKTFLEYLTAYYIYANFQIKGKILERNKILVENLSNSYWYIVIELFFMKVDKESMDSEIIDQLIVYLLENKNKEAVEFLLPIIPNIKNINYATNERVIKSAINLCLRFINHANIESNITFYHLADLLKIDKYYNTTINAITEILEISNPNDLTTFILELHYTIKKEINAEVLLKFISIHHTNTPYNFILYNLKKTEMNWNEYFSQLSIFANIFDNVDLLTTYTSKFNSSIFKNYDKFNWVYSSLFTVENARDFTKNIKLLEIYNISIEKIEMNYNAENVDDKLPIDMKLSLLINPLMYKLIQLSLPIKIDKRKNINIPFYAKFNKGRHDRNFKK